MLFRAAVSGLCVAQAFGTGEHGALMQSQANTEDLDAILLSDTAEKPRAASNHHLSHSSHERARAKLVELQSTAESLEHKYKAILHAKVEKVAKKGPADGSVTAYARPEDPKNWKGSHEYAPAADMFDGVDALLIEIEGKLEDEAGLNRELVRKSKDVLTECNNDRRYEFDLPRYMDYYFYMKTIKHICTNFDGCWDEAQDNWEKLRANTEVLEGTQKTIYKVLRKARCYVEHIKLNTPSAEDIAECVALDADVEHLDIVYDPEIVRDVCDICSYEEGSGGRGSREENMIEWSKRHHKTPQDGIVNAAKIMYEMVEAEGLTEQHRAEQEDVYRTNREVAACNTVKRATWESEQTDLLRSTSEAARGSHNQCRSSEIVKLKDMQESCIEFRKERHNCNWPYWFSSEGGNQSLDKAIGAAKECSGKIADANPLSKECDTKQGVHEDEFCTYFASKNKTCWDHTICYDRETAERADDIAFVKAREHSLKLQHRMVKMNLCFIHLYQGATDAVDAASLDDADLHRCVDEIPVDDSHLDIEYPAAEVKDECDTSDIQYYPGENDWEELEYAKAPFTDTWNSMASIDSCSFHSSAGLIQKMKATSRPKSMRSP